MVFSRLSDPRRIDDFKVGKQKHKRHSSALPKKVEAEGALFLGGVGCGVVWMARKFRLQQWDIFFCWVPRWTEVFGSFVIKIMGYLVSRVMMIMFHFFFVFSLLIFGEMIQFDDHIFQTGWFNHQLDIACYLEAPFPPSGSRFSHQLKCWSPSIFSNQLFSCWKKWYLPKANQWESCQSWSCCLFGGKFVLFFVFAFLVKRWTFKCCFWASLPSALRC